MKKHQKEQLPGELFRNSQKDKRGKAELTKSLNIRLSSIDHKRLKELVKELGCSQSNMLRYFISDGLANLNLKIKEVEEQE